MGIECGTVNTITSLSIFSAAATCILLLVTTPLTALILIVISRNKRNKFRGLFYKLLLNIVVADFLTATVVNIASIMFYVREASRVRIGKGIIYTMHLSLFLTDAVALVTLTMLSVDRIIALTRPYDYRKGLKNGTENALVTSSWLFATMLVIPYFYVDFIRQLAVFTAVNVLITIVFLVATLLVYHFKFLSPVGKNLDASSASNGTPRPARSLETDIDITSDSKNNILERFGRIALDSTNIMINVTCTEVHTDIFKNSELVELRSSDFKDSPPSSPKFTRKKKKYSQTDSPKVVEIKSSDLLESPPSSPKFMLRKFRQSQRDNHPRSRSNVQKRVTHTFLIMLLVFIVTYLPTCVLMIYMNVCTKCDCDLIHVMRDLSILSIASSSTFRSLNFILTLNHVKSAINQLRRSTKR